MFEEVKGVDLSESFILKCKTVKETGEIYYQMPVEGDILRAQSGSFISLCLTELQNQMYIKLQVYEFNVW